jgi:hypothetical protein
MTEDRRTKQTDDRRQKYRRTKQADDRRQKNKTS